MSLIYNTLEAYLKTQLPCQEIYEKMKEISKETVAKLKFEEDIEIKFISTFMENYAQYFSIQ